MIKRLLRLKGLNLWILGSSLGLNLLVSLGVLTLALYLVNQSSLANLLSGAAIILSLFVGCFLSAWLMGAMAGDGRGPTYGIYGGFFAAVLAWVILAPGGMVAVLAGLAAIAGGFNGGVWAEVRRR
jgi:hypothetical protein